MDVIERIERLEKKLRHMRIAAAASLTLLGAGLLMGQAPNRTAKVVEASAFLLVDENGKERASLQATKDGGAALIFRHQDAVTDARFALLGDGSISLSMKNPKKSATLELAQDGTAALRINEKYAKSAVEVGIDNAGRPRVMLLDPQGKAVFLAPTPQ
jgi:hypothetical protein